jgi:hypothetical protein
MGLVGGGTDHSTSPGPAPLPSPMPPLKLPSPSCKWMGRPNIKHGRSGSRPTMLTEK